MGELEAVHRARHLDVSENQVNIGTRFQDAYCLVGIGRFNHIEAGGRHQVHGTHSDDRIVFNDQNDRLGALI